MADNFRSDAVVVCLCGSTRYKEAFLAAAADEALAGRVVLMPGVFSKADGMALSDTELMHLTELHRRKIDLADEILIIGGADTVGADTAEEITYAGQFGKPVRFWETRSRPSGPPIDPVEALTESHRAQRGLYLLGLVKHVAGAAYYWLCDIFGRPDLLPTEDWSLAVSDDVQIGPGDTAESVLADVARARASAHQAIREVDLDATATTWLGDTVSFRWAILQVIEEAARHAGHADVIRELHEMHASPRRRHHERVDCDQATLSSG